MINRIVLTAVVLATTLAMTPAQAGMVNYTLDGGTISGTLNGTPFTNAHFTITATGDTSSVVTGVLGPGTLYSLIASSTISIDGVGSGIFSSSTFGPSSVHYPFPGNDLSGFGDASQPLAFTIDAGSAANDLQTLGTVSGNLIAVNTTYGTSAGDLIITNSGGIGSFTVSAVPEPSTLMSSLVAIGAGLAAVRALRVRQVTG